MSEGKRQGEQVFESGDIVQARANRKPNLAVNSTVLLLRITTRQHLSQVWLKCFAFQIYEVILSKRATPPVAAIVDNGGAGDCLE